MTEPKRWSSPGSEVDPVLRSVLLYARDLEPTSQQLQAILRGAEGRRPAPKRRRFVAFVLAGAAAACAGVAWAGYAGGLLFNSTPPVPSVATAATATPPSAARRHAQVAPTTPPGAAPATTRGLDSASPSEPRPEQPAASPSAVEGATAPRVAPSAPTVMPSVSPEQDAALLQQAQRLVATEPARALTLTRDHELHFPSSPLLEERQALRIEALARLGRRTEALRDLSSFDQHFPRSIYRHRLHALLPD